MNQVIDLYYTHRLVIARTDEQREDDKGAPVEVGALAHYLTSEESAVRAFTTYIADRVKDGFTPAIVNDHEIMLDRKYSRDDADRVELRVYYESLRGSVPLPEGVPLMEAFLAEMRALEQQPLTVGTRHASSAKSKTTTRRKPAAPAQS